MKFGPVPVAQAKETILAHSLHLPNGRLRKGHVLSEADVAAAEAAGVLEITVAQLESGDLHEDSAAATLAGALRVPDQKIELSAAFTGRVNLLAKAPGVVTLDVARLNLANAVDPMVTIATVPPFHQIHPGGMIATVKIISYAVQVASIEAAVEIARAAIGLATPVFATASLILTDIPGCPGSKGTDAIEHRLTGLGMTLLETLTVAHREDTLAQAMEEAKGDVILVLTGSATSDPNDTGPNALGLAGGQVERFGIPVDPGNLLFLGHIGGRPVIGLPGSARSPVLHGADWVLSRVACGLSLSDADFAAMGVGGLLKEIPTRPQPRQGRNRPG